MKPLLVIIAICGSIIAGTQVYLAYRDNAAWQAGSLQRSIDSLDSLDRINRELKGY